MKKFENILWGIAFIVVGLILAGNAIGITNIDIFFVSRHFRAKIFSSGREKAAISGSFRAFPK